MNDFDRFDESTLLFAMPSVKRGIARIIAPYGRVASYAYSSNGKMADSRAIRSDWRAVGRDLLKAMGEYRREIMAAR